MNQYQISHSLCSSNEAQKIVELGKSLHQYFNREPGNDDIIAAKLCRQVRDLFFVLDKENRQCVSREDFECVTRALELDSVLTVSNAEVGSVIHWLPAYTPNLPHTPPSPLRTDMLTQVENQHISKSNTSKINSICCHNPSRPTKYDQHSSRHFLWTESETPFWESWYLQRHKRNRLSLAEFTLCLLELWASNHGYPITSIERRDISPNWNSAITQKKPVNNNENPVKMKSFYSKIISPTFEDIDPAKDRDEMCLKRHADTVEVYDNVAEKDLHLLNTNSNHIGIPPLEIKVPCVKSSSRLPLQAREISQNLSKSHYPEKKQITKQQESIENNNVSTRTINYNSRKSTSSFLEKSNQRSMCFSKENIPNKKMFIPHIAPKNSNRKIHIVTPPSTQLWCTGIRKSWRGKNKRNNWRRKRLSFQRKKTSILNIPNNQMEDKYLLQTAEHIRDCISITEAKNITLRAQLEKINNQERVHTQMHRSNKQFGPLRIELSTMTNAPWCPSLSSNGKTSSSHSCTSTGLEPVQTNSSQLEVIVHKDAVLSNGTQSYPSQHAESSIISGPHKESESFLKEDSKAKIQECSQNVLIGESAEVDTSAVKGRYQVLNDAEMEIERLRKNLLEELKSTKNLLMSSLKNVTMLEMKSSQIDDKASFEDLKGNYPGSIDIAISQNTKKCEVSPPSSLTVSISPNTIGDRSFSPRADSQKCSTQTSGHYSATPSPSSNDLLTRDIKDQHSEEHYLWCSERRKEREKLSKVEDSLRDILCVIRSLNSMNISKSVLGGLVLDAVEKSWDPVAGEVAVFKFLSLLYQSSREQERNVAKSLLVVALDETK